MKTYIIYETLIYRIEAETEEEALEIMCEDDIFDSYIENIEEE